MPEPPFPGTVTPDEFRRIREIFEAALERPVDERRAFVEHACGGNAAVRTEVERMLATEGDRHRLLDRASTRADDALSGGVAPVAPVLCPSCRASLTPSHRFCPSCGTPTAGGLVEEGRFRAGALFAGRFRIVAALGRGGMGEVYRAHDLELGQPVALKFLSALRSPPPLVRTGDELRRGAPAPVAAGADERARARLRTEVRLARQIAHPNVCRVYDIGEAHGELYLSMEYVDGEDLAALLKRIGRLPVDKGIEIARKLCAGLAAAHAKGVLHRDFKPANIMIDSAGEVRIMDFGLAAIASELEGAEVRSGTPAYMAPEQLAGRDVTKQSDLYALGLVLYELFTGKPPFAAKEVPELQRQRESHPQTTPSTWIPDLDPRLESTILRCLQPDAKQRPASALDVAAALPGGDPLAEALAAGETPSPDMVAAAGPEGSISPVAGIACLVAIAAGLVAIVWMSQRTTLTSYVPLERSAEVLIDRARTIAADLGYTGTPVATAYGYEVNLEYLREIRDTDASPARWEVLRDDRMAPLGFWYRQSPEALWPVSASANRPPGGVTLADPPNTLPGMVTLVLDPGGRLTRLTAIPQQNGGAIEPRAIDWPALFQHADLPFDRFSRTARLGERPQFATQQAAWEGTLAARADLPIRVEAAEYLGLPVQFDVIAPWTRPARSGPAGIMDDAPPAGFLTLALFAAAFFVARSNLSLGRADRRGAWRVGAVIAAGAFLSFAPMTQNTGDLIPLGGRGQVFWEVVGLAIVSSAVYLALEPYARRVWPEMLIGWNRLMAGRLRDPLVGGEVLFGTVAGTCLALLPHLRVLVTTWLGLPPPIPLGPLFEESIVGPLSRSLLGGGYAASFLLGEVSRALSNVLVTAFFLSLLTMLLRRRWLASIAWVVILTPLPRLVEPYGPVADAAFYALVFGISVVVLTRIGLLAHIVALMLFLSLGVSAIVFAFDAAAPQAFASYLALGTVIALAIYGFRTAVAGRAFDPPAVREPIPR